MHIFLLEFSNSTQQQVPELYLLLAMLTEFHSQTTASEHSGAEFSADGLDLGWKPAWVTGGSHQAGVKGIKG